MKTRLKAIMNDENQRMVRFVRLRLQDAADRDAEDVVQDVLTSFMVRLNVAAPLEDISAYLYRALRNRIVDMFRSRRETISLELESPLARGDESQTCLLQGFCRTPERQMRANEAAEELYLAMESLSSLEREIIMAVEIEGYTYRELAALWGVPINTLLSRKSRAMFKLKTRLSQTPVEVV